MNIVFEPANFLTSMQYMGMGMLGIFVVIGSIILVTMALNKFTSRKED